MRSGVARATESRTQAQRSAERLIARLPLIVAEMRELIGSGVGSLSTPERIVAAREAIRKVLEGGAVRLKPNADHTAVVGEISFVALGSHLLEIAGIRREMRGTGAEKPLVNQLQENMAAGARFGTYLHAYRSTRPPPYSHNRARRCTNLWAARGAFPLNTLPHLRAKPRRHFGGLSDWTDAPGSGSRQRARDSRRSENSRSKYDGKRRHRSDRSLPRRWLTRHLAGLTLDSYANYVSDVEPAKGV